MNQYVVEFVSMVIDADDEESAIEEAGDFKGGGNWQAIPVEEYLGRKPPEPVAAEARRPYVLAQKANIARLVQLVEDTIQREADAANDQQVYWAGFADGLARAIKVLEGEG